MLLNANDSVGHALDHALSHVRPQRDCQDLPGDDIGDRKRAPRHLFVCLLAVHRRIEVAARVDPFSVQGTRHRLGVQSEFGAVDDEGEVFVRRGVVGIDNRKPQPGQACGGRLGTVGPARCGALHVAPRR